jgi:DNA-binding NtrC family response regulator
MNEFRILLIDDDVLSLTSLAKALRLNGFEVDAFSDPEAAWQIFQENPYSIVLSDIMMKPLDGFEVLDLIKSTNPTTRVILFTGFFTDKRSNEAIAMGAEKVYSKPVPIEDIIAELNKSIFKKGGSYE